MTITKSPAANGRFGAMAAATPQTIFWEIARYHPAGSSVEATTAPSRFDVVCQFRRYIRGTLTRHCFTTLRVQKIDYDTV